MFFWGWSPGLKCNISVECDFFLNTKRFYLPILVNQNHSLWFSGIENKLELTWKSEYDAFLWSAAGNEMFAMKPGDIGIRVFSGILE